MCDEIEALSYFCEIPLLLHRLVRLHPLVPEALLALPLDFLHALHGSDRLFDELAVVLDGTVAESLELEGGIHAHLLTRRTPEGLRPLELTRVELVLEGLVALAAAELEDFGVVAHEGDAVAGVAGAGAHVAVLDPHRPQRRGAGRGGATPEPSLRVRTLSSPVLVDREKKKESTLTF